jgi:hypothetical protein
MLVQASKARKPKKTHLRPVFPIVGATTATVYMWLDLSVQVGAMLVALYPVPVRANATVKIGTSRDVETTIGGQKPLTAKSSVPI